MQFLNNCRNFGWASLTMQPPKEKSCSEAATSSVQHPEPLQQPLGKMGP